MESSTLEPFIGICTLASGSRGNCTYVGTPQTKILIDAGIFAKTIQQRLASLHVSLSDIDAILISHEHTDHIRGLPLLAGKRKIPIFANGETTKVLHTLLPVQCTYKIFSTNEPFEWKDLEIHPFSIQHDAQDPVGFTLKWNAWKVGICTDLGFPTTLVAHSLKECHYLIIEANHEPSMVHSSARPPQYKERVLGKQGHLSNEECGRLLIDIYHKHLQEVLLAHISQECNHPEWAQKKISSLLEEKGYRVPLSIAHQDRISKPFTWMNTPLA